MNTKTRILIVEDDMIIAANLSLQLTKLGYEVTGIESRGEEAVVHARVNTPDIILMDINLKGSIDGIETVKIIQQTHDIPVVYLTANTDDASFFRAKETHPEAFVSKPFNQLDLQHTIALVEDKILTEERASQRPKTDMQVMGDRIFVRHKGKMNKLMLDQILYLEADRNYTNIVTEKGHYLLSSTLKTLEAKLPQNSFLRVHRSYIVNVKKLDAIADTHLEIKRKVIPLSKSNKELLLSSIRTV
tara:strand:- start:209 stop:943 length:735 start_codon:yes stop_codon:yes gene_type:complete